MITFEPVLGRSGCLAVRLLLLLKDAPFKPVSVIRSTYHRYRNIEWLLKDKKEVESSSHPSNSSIDVANKEIPCVQTVSNGSKCQKHAEVHRGTLKFSSPLGWEILSERGSLSNIVPSPYTHWNGRWNQDGIVISTTGCAKSIY